MEFETSPADAVFPELDVTESAVIERLTAELGDDRLPEVTSAYNRTYNRHNR